MSDTASRIVHPLDPIFDDDSEVLILGSFPSVKSREQHFYYGHPQNRFWKVLSQVLTCPLPKTTDDKTSMLLSHHIALWDVIASCEITGSSDASIKNVKANDLSIILSASKIKLICANGAKAYELYNRYIFPEIGVDAVKLPSTSPANAAWSIERLVNAWSVIVLR